MNHAVKKLFQLILNGSQVCTDSRLAKPGDIFFALQGENFDGNAFAADALNAGCVIAVTDKPDHHPGEKYVHVPDALKCLQELAIAFRRQFNLPMLGITGTNGKTTTKELMQAAFSQKFNSFATIGNLNNHIGVPLTLLSLPKNTELAVVEMGANHLGEIARLAEIAQPTHALITNIGKAHLEGFGSVDNIEKAKTELYDYVINNKGTLFVNGDDSRLKKFADGKNRIAYGQSQENHCCGKTINIYPYLEIYFWTTKGFGRATKDIKGQIKSRLTGKYNFSNIMAAVTAGLYFGVPVEKIISGIESYEPKNNRSQIIETQRNTVLMDAYNANPTSMAAAIENFLSFDEKPKAVFLGDMLELGNDAVAEHRKIPELLKEQAINQIVYVGKVFSSVCREAPGQKVFSHVDEASQWLKNNTLENHNILIKGSRGIQMEKLLPHL